MALDRPVHAVAEPREGHVRKERRDVSSSRRHQLETMRAFIEAELAKAPPETPPPPPPASVPAFMTVEEYAKRIRVTPATVRRMVREENLPHVRPRPRLIRIRVTEADGWIAARESGALARRRAVVDARRGVGS
jgi:excisionase family DNA binding protein